MVELFLNFSETDDVKNGEEWRVSGRTKNTTQGEETRQQGGVSLPNCSFIAAVSVIQRRFGKKGRLWFW